MKDMKGKMVSSTGYYILYDVNGSETYHLYKIITIYDNNECKYGTNPICGQVESSISNIDNQSNVEFITEREFIDKIINILNNRHNDKRLCKNCIIDMIAEKQDIFF